MNSYMKNILFFDVDDTLIHHRGDKSYIPTSTIATLKKLKRNGHIVAIASGRSYQHIHSIMTYLNIEHAVCCNGHQLVEHHKIVKEIPFDQDEIRRLIKKIKNGFYPAVAMTRERVFVKDFFGKIEKEFRKSVRSLEGIKDHLLETNLEKFSLEPLDYLGMMFFNPGFKDQATYQHLVFKKWGRRGYEVANKGTSKLTGIIEMANHFEVAREHIYVFGDNYNDIEMLTGIDNSVAMGNAIDEAKAVASYTTSHVGEDGILNACRYYGLI